MSRMIVSTGFTVLAAAAASALAQTNFDSFTPIPASVAAGSLPESAPLQFGSPSFTQTSIADRTAQLAAGQFNSGAWDMNTVNETGPDAGRYLFTVFETGQSGVQRTDLTTNTTTTVWSSPAPAPALNSHVAFDASYWTPFGTYITAEESWGAQPQPYGRLFELTNATTATGNVDANFVHRNAVPRVSHEGIQFDNSKNMYFIDELNGGSIYKYTSQTPNIGASYFSAGETSVLRVGTGTTPNATGAFSWLPFTDATGAALAGAVTVVDPNGVSAVDGRASTDVAAFKGTDYQRPEDLQIKRMPNGDEVMFAATTTTNEVYSINLTTGNVSVLANRNTLDAASNVAVGNAFTSPDNLAIDAEGNIYIIEDQPGGAADIWLAEDANNDGIAESVGRWATMSTVGAEPTGLYFDPFDPNVAYVNIQHPASGVDRTLRINAIPEPTTFGLLAAGVSLLGLRRRR